MHHIARLKHPFPTLSFGKFRNGGHIGSNHRRIAGKSFQHNQAETLQRFRRQHKTVSSSVTIGQLFFRQSTEQHDAVLQSRGLDSRLQRFTQRTAATNQSPKLQTSLNQQLTGIDQRIQSHTILQSTQSKEHRTVDIPVFSQNLPNRHTIFGWDKPSRLDPAWCNKSFVSHGPSMPLRHHRQGIARIALNLIGQSTVPSVDSASHQRCNPLCDSWLTTGRIT